MRATSQAQATVESDRVRIFKEITEKIGMEKLNAQLQEYLERAMRAAATEVLLERGGVENLTAGGSKATLGLLRGELEETKQALVKAQEETKQVLVKAQEETKQEVLGTKQGVKETKQELVLLTTAQEEASKEVKLLGERMAGLEGRMDVMLELLRGTGSRSSGTESQ
jgi:hypothetical protein